MSQMQRYGFTKAAWRSCYAIAKSCARPVLRRLRATRTALTSLCLTPGRNRRRERLVSSGAERKRVTLFLAPEAGIAPFFASHALLARVMADAGHTAVLLSCNGMQPTCSVKLAMQIGVTKPHNLSNPACVRCRGNALRVGRDYDLVDVSLESLLDAPLRDEIRKVMSANKAAPWQTNYDDIEIGSACLGETLRARRKVSVDELTSEDRELLVALLHSSLAVYVALKVLAARFDIERIAYFGDYAYFIAPQVFAARHDIPLTNVSHAYNRDIDRRYLNLRPGHGFSHMMSQVSQWNQYSDIPITPQLVADIVDGALFRLYGYGGASTYSPNWIEKPGDIREQLGLPEGGRLLVAFSNSTDELACNRQILRVLGLPYEGGRNPFPNQIEWLKELVRWVGLRPDLRLIIRLHPRMAIGHRHTTVASEYKQMKTLLASLPPNVAVVWPESKLSSYNIAECADVVLTAWSSIGLELARFGLPVVTAFQRIGPCPIGRFSWFEETVEDHFRSIERALSEPASMESIAEAFRWTHFLHWSPLIDVSDVTPEADYKEVPPYRSPRNRETILKVMSAGEDLVALNMDRLPRGDGAKNAERAAVTVAVKKFILYFMTGRVVSHCPDLRIKLAAGDIAMCGGARAGGEVSIEVGTTDIVTLTTPDGTFRRYSPLVARLARTVAEAESGVPAFSAMVQRAI